MVSVVTAFCISDSFAGKFALFGSLQATHSAISPSGGVRYSLNDDICFDATLGAGAGYDDSSYNGITAYLDAFFFKQTIGVGLTFNKHAKSDALVTVGLLYALEKQISDNITLGVSPTIVSKTFAEGYGVDFLSGFSIYTVLGF